MHPTLTDFLMQALLPVGRVLYVWGGGWNEADDRAGIGATVKGLYPRWDTFYRAQASPKYDYRDHRFMIEDGLDCSGYVGWAIYQCLGRKGESFVTASASMASFLQSHALGRCLSDNRAEFSLPGDIVSMKGHIYISLGVESDGSVLLLHASPPAVSLCGTEGDGIGKASRLARWVMETAYPTHTATFPYRGRDHRTYTEGTEVFRFSEQVLPDPQRLRALSPRALLNLLFPTLTIRS